jgi:hypothetical protein
MKKHLTLATCLIAGLTGVGQAEASTLSFSCISSNVANDCSIGQSQFSVDLNSTVKGVSFTFKNNAIFASSITEVYFDAAKSSLSGAGKPTLSDSDGATGKAVVFALEANPDDLPGGKSIKPKFSTSNDDIFSAGSDAGKGGQMAHGVNAASEWLNMDYSINSGKTFSDVLAELGNGKLRIGIHVTGFDDGKSASFVNNPLSQFAPIPQVASVPVPAATWLLGSGLLGLVGVARRKAVS